MDTLRSLYSRPVDKEQAGQTKGDPNHLTDRNYFPVKQDSHSDENNSQTDVGYQGSQADHGIHLDRYVLGTDVVQHIRGDDEQNRKIVGHETPP